MSFHASAPGSKSGVESPHSGLGAARPWIPLVMVGVALLVGLALQPHGGQGPRRDGAPAPLRILAEAGLPIDARASTRPTWPPRLGWEPGMVLEYAYAHSQRVKMELSAEMLSTLAQEGRGTSLPQSQEVEIGLDATLTLRVYAEADGAMWVGYRFAGARVSFLAQGTPSGPEVTDEIARRIDAEVLTRVTRRGEMLDLRFPPEWNAEARELLKSYLSTVRVVLPEGAERSWTAMESDSTGSFLARYETSSADAEGNIVVEKRKEYRALHAASSFASGEPIPEARAAGSVRIALSVPTGMILEIEGEEELDLAGQGLTHVASGSSRVSVRLQGVRRESADLDPVLASASAEGFAPGGGSNGAGESKDRVDAAAMSLATLLEGLDQELAQSGEKADFAPYLRDLTVLFRHRPGAIEEALVALRNGEVRSERAASMLLSSLGQEGSPAAQAALAAIVNDPRLTDALRRNALFGVALVERPCAEFDEALWGKVQESVGDSDGLALGALEVMGILADRHGNGGDVERADECVLRIEAELARSTTPLRKRAALVGLGNAARERSMGALVAQLRDPDPMVRAAALRAMRRMPEGLARPVVEAAIAGDELEGVREAASEVLDAWAKRQGQSPAR